MKIQEQVENLLKYLPETRNSDKALLIAYMQKYGLNLTEQQIELFKKMPSTETIRRSRQIIQEQGKYAASDQVNEERYKKYQTVKQNIKYETPEQLLESKGYKVLPFGE